MTLRRLKQALGLQAARHGSERLWARIGEDLFEVPLDANVITIPSMDLLYVGLGKPQSILCRRKAGVLELIGEDEAEALSVQIEGFLADVTASRNADVLARANAALAEAAKDLPSGWRIAVGNDGKARAVRLRNPEAASAPDTETSSKARPLLLDEPISEDPFAHPDEL